MSIEAIPQPAQDRLRVALSAAQEAGALIRDGYHDAQEIEEKGLGDLFCGVDLACDAAIQERILAHDPSAVILSEELNPAIGDGETRWVVDPLDGSAAFLFQASREMPSTMIAYREEGQTELAVIHFPLTEEVFWAVKGQGAYKNDQPIGCARQIQQLGKAWVEVNRNADQRLQNAAVISLDERLRLPGGACIVTTSPPHSGLAARMASGEKRLSAIVHDNNAGKVKQGPWDVIPAALVLEEAGGVVGKLEDGEPYDPFHPEPFVMAASQAMLDQLVSLAV